MKRNRPKLLVVCAAGMGAGFLEEQGVTALGGMPVASLKGVFPAVTCTAQASFRSGAPPAVHGMIANGLMDRRFRQVRFWEQAASLVEGERIWDAFRRKGGRVGLCFWQQSLGESVDLMLSPAPIHRHGGGMVMDCAGEPAGLYPELRRELGGFPLQRYWGPLASARVGEWIGAAAATMMARPEAPDLLLLYLPTLDYDLQRHGPAGLRAARACAALCGQLEALLAAATACGYQRLVFGDYAISEVTGPVVYPNRALREAGLLAIRDVRGRAYPAIYRSRAFAMVDHEVAHVYVPAGEDLAPVHDCLSALPGVAEVWSAERMRAEGVGHAAAGELLLLAEQGRWFAYPWWTHRREEPDYARHIDIHRKPGFDPCEMFFGGWPPGVSQNAGRIRGTHGRADRAVAWATDVTFPTAPDDVAGLGRAVKVWLEESA